MTDRQADAAFEGALVALIPQLRGFARSLALDRDEADDLAQQALLKAWRARDSFTPGTNLKAWVFTILRNQFYQDRVRARRQQPLDDADLDRLTSAGATEDILDLDDLRRALGLLSPEHREAIALVCLAGLPYEQASEVAGCAVGTLKSRLSRARAALAALLEGTQDLPEDGVPAIEAFGALLGEGERAATALAPAPH
jgi:RNA polymerase sigma-70 factor (ECF subfamily)